MGWFRRHYGAGPLHLLSLVACLAFAGYVASRILAGPGSHTDPGVVRRRGRRPRPGPVAALRRGRPGRRPGRPPSPRPTARGAVDQPPAGPAVLSAVLLAVSFPLVFRWSEPTYHAASGLTEAPYLGRWLLVTGSAFGVSAVLYAVRVGRVLAREKR